MLTKKLRKEARKALEMLHRDFQQHTDTVREYYERQDRQAKPNLPTPILRAELHVPEHIERNRQTHENRQHRLQVWVVIGTWAAFLAASVYAYVAVRQWGEMIGARHQTRDAIIAANRSAAAAEHGERSWLGIVTFNVGADRGRLPGGTLGPIGPNTPLVFNLVLENFGKTAAHLDEIGMAMEVRSTDVPEDFEYEWNKAPFVIFPGQPLRTNNSWPIVITGTSFKTISDRSGTPHLFIHATVNYHDVLGKHWTKTCMMWRPPGRNFNNCLTHNNADE